MFLQQNVSNKIELFEYWVRLKEIKQVLYLNQKQLALN